MGRHTRFIGRNYDIEKADRWCSKMMKRLNCHGNIENSISPKTGAMNKETNEDLGSLLQDGDIRIIGEDIDIETIKKYLPMISPVYSRNRGI